MIGNLNHIAIAVPLLSEAIDTYKNIFGAKVSTPAVEEEHGVKVAFIDLPNTKVELLEPFGTNSPLKKFLEKNPNGGIHHICYEVEDILNARNIIIEKGSHVLGPEKAKIGAHGKPVLFLHPKDFNGTLIELEEI